MLFKVEIISESKAYFSCLLVLLRCNLSTENALMAHHRVMVAGTTHMASHIQDGYFFLIILYEVVIKVTVFSLEMSVSLHNRMETQQKLWISNILNNAQIPKYEQPVYLLCEIQKLPSAEEESDRAFAHLSLSSQHVPHAPSAMLPPFMFLFSWKE